MRYHKQRTRVPFQQLRLTSQNVTDTNQTPPFPNETALHRILCDTQSLLAPVFGPPPLSAGFYHTAVRGSVLISDPSRSSVDH
ncbi:hypothetical protein BDR22DRAFT_835307 [Usnea florida]